MHIVQRLARRVGAAVILLWLVATVIFIAIRFIPGVPAEVIRGGPASQAAAKAFEAARGQYVLNAPILVQYGVYLAHLATGDLGTSYAQHRPVAQVMAEVLPATLQLTLIALILAWGIAFVMAAIAARSEEHTSELQSRFELVCRLLLEKKKNNCDSEKETLLCNHRSLTAHVGFTNVAQLHNVKPRRYSRRIVDERDHTREDDLNNRCDD